MSKYKLFTYWDTNKIKQVWSIWACLQITLAKKRQNEIWKMKLCQSACNRCTVFYSFCSKIQYNSRHETDICHHENWKERARNFEKTWRHRHEKEVLKKFKIVSEPRVVIRSNAHPLNTLVCINYYLNLILFVL